MAEFWHNIKFGLGLGIGLMLAYALLRLVVWFLSQAAPIHF